MTLVIPNDKGAPPEYPTSQMVPDEFWRHQPDGDPDNIQIQTVELSPGVYVKREVERGWTKPVTFSTEAGDL